ncbi:MAG: DUF2332 domain-containing protein [Alphaproteobacteria bacterium]|nr:DUF2332 domain-containing protein [Alphaproteobacteria bacterium]
MSQQDIEAVGALYERFADVEARGRSPLYEGFARGVAADAELLGRIADLPSTKRQPNLLLAAVRHVAGLACDPTAFRRTALARWPEVRAVMLARSTQTNEPGRCATLLPLLACLPQPIALIEVGASAGLCLLPDRYRYAFNGREVGTSRAACETPVFACRTEGAVPVPGGLPVVAWRAGLDLNPLDATDADATAWLETLVWPEATGRAERLRAALAIARTVPPRVIRGDLRHDLPRLAAEAPSDATLVVFHTAVLAYLSDPGERAAFANSVRAICDHWISNEAPAVFPTIAAQAGSPPARERFLLALDGRPVAWTDPHGTAMKWIEDARTRK